MTQMKFTSYSSVTIIVEQKHSNLQNFYLPSVSNMTIQASGLSELNDQEKIEIKWKRGSRKGRDWQKVATFYLILN